MPRWKNGPMKCDQAGPLAKTRSRLTSTCSAMSAPAVTYILTPKTFSRKTSP